MSFFDHLEDLRWHLIRSIAVIMAGGILSFVFISNIYNVVILGPTRNNFITFRILCHIDQYFHLGHRLCMQAMHIHFQNMEVSGQFMLSITSAMLIGLIVAVPFVLWEFWNFIKPALKPNEIKYTRGVVFWSSLLFFIGVCFAYFCIVPYAMSFFSSYKISNQFQNIFTIQSYLDMVTQLVIGLGCIFELPILVFFLTKVGLLTPTLLKTYRRHAIVVIVVLAAFIAPPDFLSQIIVSLPLYLLYEISIGISGKVLRQKEKTENKWV